MPCVPPSLLKAQVSPQLHSLHLPLWSPVLHVQVGFIGAGHSSCSDTGLREMQQHCSMCTRCLLVGLPAPRSLAKTHMPAAVLWLLSSYGPTHPPWETSCLCVCASNAIHYCSALPSDSLYLFLQQEQSFKQVDLRKSLRSQISQLKIFCHFWEKSAVCTNPQAQ